MRDMAVKAGHCCQFNSTELLNTQSAVSWLNLFTSFNQSIKQVSLEVVKAESRE